MDLEAEELGGFEKEICSQFEYREFMLVKFSDKKVETVLRFDHPYYQSFRKKPDAYGVI